jgi:hypothetical protein
MQNVALGILFMSGAVISFVSCLYLKACIDVAKEMKEEIKRIENINHPEKDLSDLCIDDFINQ